MSGREILSLNRIKRLKKEILSLNAHAYLSTTLSNIRYLIADPALDYGPLALLVPLDGEITIWVETLGSEQARRALKKFNVETVKKGTTFEACLSAKAFGNGKIVFDELTYSGYKIFRRKLPRASIVPRPDILRRMRETKDKNELMLISKASNIADIGMKAALEALRGGVTEFEVAAEAEYAMRLKGSEGTAFSTIVASGTRSALPHANPTMRKIRNGDMVVIDIGARFQGYCSDLTRTAFIGNPSSQQTKVYRAVLEAQKTALDNICVPMDGHRADSLAREVIKKYGYEKYFIHGLGHGVGLDIHEAPRLGSHSRDLLKNGNVLTVEPGVYIPRKFGVRLEDTAAISNGQLAVLTHCEKSKI